MTTALKWTCSCVILKSYCTKESLVELLKILMPCFTNSVKLDRDMDWTLGFFKAPLMILICSKFEDPHPTSLTLLFSWVTSISSLFKLLTLPSSLWLFIDNTASYFTENRNSPHWENRNNPKGTCACCTTVSFCICTHVFPFPSVTVDKLVHTPNQALTSTCALDPIPYGLTRTTIQQMFP